MKVRQFQDCQTEAICVFFIGAVNHWVTVVAHKKAGAALAEMYLLDSTNVVHLNQSSYEDVHNFYMREGVWKKIKLGLRPSNKFMAKMYL